VAHVAERLIGMNSNQTYALVGCNVLLQGVVRSMAPKSVTLAVVEAGLVDEVAVSSAQMVRKEQLPSQGRTYSLHWAQSEPDLFVYQVCGDWDRDCEIASKIRQSCKFRDVPLLLAAEPHLRSGADRLFPTHAEAVFTFPCRPSDVGLVLHRAMQPVGTRLPVVAKLVNPFISAAVEVLSTMAGMKAEKREIYLKKNYRLLGDVSGIMTIGGSIEGTVVVSLGEELARSIVGKIISVPPKQVTQDEVRDGIGELVNIVSGNARAALAQSEYEHKIELPTVATGMDKEMAHPRNAPCIVILFDVGGEPMAVMVSMALRAAERAVSR
jgi:chemotaxis protein CheX